MSGVNLDAEPCEVIRDASPAIGCAAYASNVVSFFTANPVRAFGNLAPRARQVFVTLTRREQRVLRLRFGIGERSGYTRAEVGRRLLVTGERIRQIEANALRKLRHGVRARRRNGYLEA